MKLLQMLFHLFQVQGKKGSPFLCGIFLINNGLFNSTVIQLWELHAPFFITDSKSKDLQVIFRMNYTY